MAEKTREEELYEKEQGTPRRLPNDHPDAWQWEYAGSRKEREDLLERLSDEPVPDPLEGQEELPL